jgi:competence protein ComEC
VESLALAALSILTVRPNDLFDPGFQLSFAAVVGFFIVFSRPRNNDEHNDIQVSRAVRIRSFAVRLLRSTLAAHAATAPIALYHFGVVSWISPLANLVAVPMSEFVIMPILFVALIIEPLSQTVSAWMIKFACLLIQMLNNFLSYLSEFPCTIESPGIFATISIVALSVTLLFAATKIRTSGLAAAVCLGLTALAVLFDPPKIAPGFLTVHFFDVGQGDSALITSPKGRHLLVDGGPLTRSGFNTGERVIVPALRSLHVSSLDSVYSTHPDSDHIGGLPAVIRALRVKRLFENGQEGSTNPQDLYRDLLAVATSRHVTLLRAPSICRSIEFDGASVEVIHPCNPTASGADASDTNDNSLVIVVKLKRVSLLMLGDISESVETMLARSGRFPTADIVKVAHHGSQTSTSSAMLDRVQPIFAVISVGRFNRFGMPHREVIERLTHRNIRIMRTDLLGPIVFRTDGRVIEIGPLDIK